MELGTPLGLGLASGLNAYLPLLAFAVAARWLHLYHVNPQFAFITSDWCIIALVVLTLLNFVADKIPIVNHVWDATQTVVRPLAGALVAAASSQQATLPVTMAAVNSHVVNTASTAIPDVHITGAWLVIIALLGGILALMIHSAKFSIRLFSTLTTAGLLNVFLSFGEDLLVCIAIAIALFVPAVMLILIVLFLLLVGPRILRIWGRRAGSRAY